MKFYIWALCSLNGRSWAMIHSKRNISEISHTIMLDGNLFVPHKMSSKAASLIYRYRHLLHFIVCLAYKPFKPERSRDECVCAFCQAHYSLFARIQHKYCNNKIFVVYSTAQAAQILQAVYIYLCTAADNSHFLIYSVFVQWLLCKTHTHAHIMRTFNVYSTRFFLSFFLNSQYIWMCDHCAKS